LWLEAETVSTGSAMVPQDELHAAYAVACMKANQPIVTKQMFGRTLKRLRPELREAQRMIGGRKRWVYLGIGMKNGSVETLKKGDGTPLERERSLESLDQGDSSWW
jgi:RFX DNA-binding domain-containing protein